MTTIEALTTSCKAPAWGEPGIFRGVDFETYASLVAANKTMLSCLAETPADAKDFLDNGGETSDSLEFGIGSHCLVLEPEKFATEFAIGPDVKLNTKEGKEEWGKFAVANLGKRLIRGAAGASMLKMRDRLFEHPYASSLLRCDGMNEVSFVWRDPVTGVLCKGRADRIIHLEGRLCIVDYKSTRSAAANKFPRDYADLLYFMQEAMYRDGLSIAFDQPIERFFFVAQEKTSPFKVNVFEFPEERVEQGRRLYRTLLKTYAHCLKTNRWPAIGQQYDTQLIQCDVPPYAMQIAD